MNPVKYKLFTAIGQTHRGKHLRFIVMATTESEAAMWVQRYLGQGMGKILSIGEGEAGMSAQTGSEDETWVYDQNNDLKWYCI